MSSNSSRARIEVERLLHDGNWHSRGELQSLCVAHTPPEVAARQVGARYKTGLEERILVGCARIASAIASDLYRAGRITREVRTTGVWYRWIGPKQK